MYQATFSREHGWRIVITMNGETRDVCGAINSAVAWAQADILNRMRGLPKV